MRSQIVRNMIRDARMIIWDFDGVIKDSVGAKAEAYQSLFESEDISLKGKIKSHHENNGGISRFEKIPLYLDWAGRSCSKNEIDEYTKRFGMLARNLVVSSPWVAGSIEYLRDNRYNQVFILVTATPGDEIAEIMTLLEMEKIFTEIHGSPRSKKQCMKEIVKRFKDIDSSRAVYIGDSRSDYEAAIASDIRFVLRKSEYNRELWALCDNKIENLSGI